MPVPGYQLPFLTTCDSLQCIKYVTVFNWSSVLDIVYVHKKFKKLMLSIYCFQPRTLVNKTPLAATISASYLMERKSVLAETGMPYNRTEKHAKVDSVLINRRREG